MAHRPTVFVVGAVVAGSILVACPAAKLPRGYDSHDLVVHGEWTAAQEEVGNRSEPLRPVEAFCGDETFLALPLKPGEEIATSMRVGERAALHLGGCVEAPEEEGAGRLEVVFDTANRRPLHRSMGLETTHAPWRKRLDLSSWAGSEATLRLQTDLHRGTLWLRQVRLVSRAVERTPARQPPPLQVLFISADTFREDALRALKNPESSQRTVSTPALDRFVGDAQVFQPHYAAAGWTRPSHGTLLTGLSPVACGALGAEGALRPGLRTLAERFRAAGFRTRALVYDVEWFHPRFGFDRGFETYRVERWRLDRAVPEVANWLSKHRHEPFFFFFHTFEPHSDARRLPYESEGTTQALVRERLGVSGYGCREGLCASHLLVALDEGRLAPLSREREVLHFLYARSGAFVDRQLGLLFDLLRRLGLYEDLLIVLTSDHGEVLLDHGELLHGKPWEEVIRVPLAIKWPGGELAGTHRTLPTGAEDLAPTLLEAAGIDASDLPGVSLRSRRRAAPVFVGHNFQAVIHGGLKAVFRDPKPPMLFDLRADPRESRNLAEERPQELERLRRLVEARRDLDRELARRLDRPSQGGEQDDMLGLTPEERRRLRSLGYLRPDA